MTIQSIDAKEKAGIQKLYRQAKKRNFNGEFTAFCELKNQIDSKKLEKMVEPTVYFNDTGNGGAQQNNTATQQTVQQPVNQDAAQAPQQTPPPPIKADDDDKIMGMNKWVFAGIAIILILVLGYGAFYYFRNRKSTMAPATAAPAEATKTNSTTTATEQSATNTAANNDSTTAAANTESVPVDNVNNTNSATGNSNVPGGAPQA